VTQAAVPGSFRDPSGFLFTRDGTLYRQVNQIHAEQYDLLLSSGLYHALVGRGLLIPHREADPKLAASAEAYRVLEPERVGFVSYPYEWSFGQLKDAAKATLQIQGVALEHGMSLRDASAYNIQFHRGHPVLIDTLSFEKLREGMPWVAYRQFCQHFLAPLALMSRRDVRLGQLLRAHLDGIPLDLATRLLPWGSRLRPSLLLHLALHARSQRRHASTAVEASKRRRPFTLRAFRGLIDSLEGAVGRLSWAPERTAWSDYYAESESYSPRSMAHKRELVGAFLDEARPRTVWDLGGNVGLFSRLASSRGIATVTIDADPSPVEANYRQVVADGDERLLPLWVDLTNPSPAIGWENRERPSLLERGPADLAMALALVHHLAIANNVPLDRVASFLRRVAARWLVVEFVPKSDPKVRELLASRQDVFGGYSQEAFELAFAERFEIRRREAIEGSARTLYLMQAR